MFAYQASNKLAAITDGTSNTIALGEIANGMIPAANGQTGYKIWAFSGYNVGESGVVGSMYGVNPWKRFGLNLTNYISSTRLGRLGDGHVGRELPSGRGERRDGRRLGPVPEGDDRELPGQRPPLDQYATNGPGPYYAGFNTYGMFPTPTMPVFNALSTRNGGEVISSDGY